MKKADKAYRTKRQLADALKRALKEAPIEKIRIHQLTDTAQIHRQSFYYHFEDINALLAWSARQDIENWLDAAAGELSWKEHLLGLMREVKENKNYFLAVQSSPACGDIQSFFREKLSEFLHALDTGTGGMDTAQDREHITAQATIILMILEQWGCGKLELSPEELLCFFESQLNRTQQLNTADGNGGLHQIAEARQKPQSQTCGAV